MAYVLELFHVSDQEAKSASVDDAPRFSAVYNFLSSQSLGDGQLFLASGDQWLPGLFYDASGDESLYGLTGAADILIQNELGIQASVFGNHEFDNGNAIIADLLSPVAEGYGGALDYAGAAFPYISGNIDFSGNIDASGERGLAPLVTENGQLASDIPGQIAEWIIVEDTNGEQFGVVGVSAPRIDEGLSSPSSGTDVAPDGPDASNTDLIAEIVQEDVDALLAANPDIDKVILLAHMQSISIEQELATKLSGVDIIMAGGSNTRLFDDDDVGYEGEEAQGIYPFFATDLDGNDVALVNTDQLYKYVGRLVIEFDENGNILPESYDPTVSGAYATDQANLDRLGIDFDTWADPEIIAITNGVRDVIAEGESEFYAITEVFLNGNRAGGGQGRDGVRSQETNLANLTGDANLAYGQAYDDSVVVSVKNGGGIRASIGTQIIPGGGATEPERLPPEEIPGVKPEGGISSNDVGNVLAFNNGLVLLTLTTEELVSILEVGVSNFTDVDTSAGGFLHFAGIRFSFDPQRDPGSRVTEAVIVDETNGGAVIAELVVDGEIVNADATHRIVTLDFLAREDNIFGGIGTDRVDLGDLAPSAEFNAIDTFDNGSEQDALAEYLFDEFGPAGVQTITAEDVPQEFDTRIVNIRAGEEAIVDVPPVELSVATFNVSMNRDTEGGLVADLSNGDNAQAQNIAEIIQRNAPDIILLNEFDFDADGNAADLFQDNYLNVSQNGAEAIDYAYSYVVDSNTGVLSGFDLNNDGTVASEADRGTFTWANDSQGFGVFPGQFAFVIYSQYEIDTDNIRTFQEFLWKDMPDARLFDETGRPLFDPERPFDPENPNDTNTSYYTQEEIDNLRLSSKNHVDVPILVDGETIHLLAAHPTPPVFDGVEDRNGKRNYDEVRFWADYVAGEDYIVDDNGVAGGLAADSRFVIVGDYNVDPFDGDSVPGAAQQLLANPLINGSMTDGPTGQGGIDNGTGGFNDTHRGNPALDTADFGFNSDDPSSDNSPGNLRVDYVLPSHYGLEIEGGRVVWPGNDDPFASVTNFPTSDHRMVINDLLLIRDTAQGALGSGGTFAAVDVTLDGLAANAEFAPIRGGHSFSSDGATLSVIGSETIAFTDETVLVVEDSGAASLARGYEVAFGRLYDIAGMSYWFDRLDSGAESLDQIATSFLASVEWQDTYGDLTDSEFVDTIVSNALDGGLGQAYRDALLEDIAAGRTSRADAIFDVADEAAVVQGLSNLSDDGILVFA